MIVADTNIIAYSQIFTDQSEVARKVLAIDPDWRVPPIWRSEFRNILARHVRVHWLALSQAIDVMGRTEQMLDHAEHSVDSQSVLQKAIDSGRSAYDCEFVVLAEDLGVPLVTADEAVLRDFPGLAVSPQIYVA